MFTRAPQRTPIAHTLTLAAAAALLLGACDAAPSAATRAPATATVRPTPIPTVSPRPLVRIPAPTATIDVTRLLATGTPSSTETPLPTATRRSAPATTAPMPTLTVDPSTLVTFGGLPLHPVPPPDLSGGVSSGFTSTILVSSTVVNIVDGVPVTTTQAIDVSEVPPPVRPLNLAPGTLNIALLGADTRPGEGVLNTDVIIIASLHPTLPVVNLLSIPRDTLVYIPNYRMYKVNTAFRRGGKDFGPELFRQTILYNFGINVDYYAMVNFRGVVNAVNTMGGISVTATCPLYQVFPRDPYYYADAENPLVVTRPHTDSFTGEVWQPGMLVPTQTIWIPRAGVYELDGLQALAYARARYGVPGGDIDRGRRAQRVIRALLSKARASISITQLPSFVEQYAKNVDTDLAFGELLSLANAANASEDLQIRSRYFEGVGLTPALLPSAGAVLIPHRANIAPYLEQALTVNENVRVNEAIPIELWNATPNADFGLAVADRLRELGFRVVDMKQVDPAPRSQLVDFSTSPKGSALPTLLKSLYLSEKQVIGRPGRASSGARYRLVAGEDFDPCYIRSAQATRSTEGTPAPPIAPEAEPAPPPSPAPPQPEPSPAQATAAP